MESQVLGIVLAVLLIWCTGGLSALSASNCATLGTMNLGSTGSFGCRELNSNLTATTPTFGRVKDWADELGNTTFIVCDNNTVTALGLVNGGSVFIQRLMWQNNTFLVFSQLTMNCNGTDALSEEVVVGTGPYSLNTSYITAVGTVPHCDVGISSVANYPRVAFTATNCSSVTKSGDFMLLHDVGTFISVASAGNLLSSQDYFKTGTLCEWSGGCDPCFDGSTNCTLNAALLAAEGHLREEEMTNLTTAVSSLEIDVLGLNISVNMLNNSISSAVSGFKTALNETIGVWNPNITTLSGGLQVFRSTILELKTSEASAIAGKNTIQARGNTLSQLLLGLLNATCSHLRSTLECNSLNTGLLGILNGTSGTNETEILENFLLEVIAPAAIRDGSLQTSDEVDPTLEVSDDESSSDFTLPVILGLTIGGAAALMAITAFSVSIWKGCRRRKGRFSAVND